jgi:hypothetical protein
MLLRDAHRATTPRVILIEFSAVAATKSAADQLLESSIHLAMVLYALIGVVNATVADLEDAFKNKRTAAELRILTGTRQSTLR